MGWDMDWNAPVDLKADRDNTLLIMAEARELNRRNSPVPEPIVPIAPARGTIVKLANVTPEGEEIFRNTKCPCGSGRKYKRCCYLRELERRRRAR